MPEGHTIHRSARDQRPLLVGKVLFVTSPQGRFRDGAKLLSAATCTEIEALGKHLLYHFDTGRVLHIHLGLAGKIYPKALPTEPPRDVVRVRLESKSHAVEIAGPAICEVLDTTELRDLRDRYGPDLLAEQPEPERAIERIRASRSNIATLLMNQKVISGIGNIYRCEILWLLKLSPMMRGCDLSEATLRELWDKMRELMQLGVEHNSIITNGDLPAAGHDVTERVNIYAQKVCPRCGTGIVMSKLAQRSLYSCPVCQKLP